MNADMTPAGTAPTAFYQQLPSIWSQTPSQAIGRDAEERNIQARLALAHWSSRPTLVLLIAQIEDLTYEHLPLAPAKSVKTRYRYTGRIPPREFPDID